MTPRALSSWVRLRIFMRSLFIQASFNPEGMQNLGLLYALYPALQVLYPKPEEQAAAVKRHLATFNTHPYVAAAIVGGILFHEEQVALGKEAPETVVSFKSSLMGPLAALGDGFFWLSLKPAVGALSVVTVPWLGAWSAALFIGLYNLVHLSTRAWLFVQGYRYGDGVVEKLSKINVAAWGQRLRALAAGCAGGLAAWAAIRFGSVESDWAAPVLVGACLATGGAAYTLVTRAINPYLVLYCAALLAGSAGAWL
ncbi:MAG: PTS system mannose/fructose/sorbose family transporter subunit IID [Myxococcaceae bacterium]|nr:PTS system mannose/fructose/sorbose family transporter subunit IID [Myxococcaceae bacterium]